MSIIETNRTSYGSNKPSGVIRYEDVVVLNSDIQSEEIVDEMTGETYINWSAVRTVMTPAEYATIHDAVESEYKMLNEQRQLEQDTVSADILDMILGGE